MHDLARSFGKRAQWPEVSPSPRSPSDGSLGGFAHRLNKARTSTLTADPVNRDVFAGLLKRRCCAAALLAGIGAGIESALPLPTFNRIGLAVAACDSADMDVAVEDVPAIGALVVAAAGMTARSRAHRGWR